MPPWKHPAAGDAGNAPVDTGPSDEDTPVGARPTGADARAAETAETPAEAALANLTGAAERVRAAVRTRREAPVEKTAPDPVLLPPAPPAGRWSPDVLGAGFQARSLPLLDDDEGEVSATLVRHVPVEDPDALAGTPSSPTFAVLYLHGWNDYFHQRELARRWSALGGAFYALDLRKYGRSLLEHQTRGYIDSFSTYDEDMHAAMRVISDELGIGTDLVLMGHSTGGLIAALWAHRHPGALRALVLNSPWLELQGSTIVRGIAQPIVDRIAKTQPHAVIPTADPGHYHRVLNGWTDEDGELPEGADRADLFYTGWAPEPAWRVAGAEVRAGWLAAVLRAHAQVAEGLDISCPVLVLTSGRSLVSPRWTPAMRSTDTVLDVEQIRRRALLLGKLVTVARFDDAIHDVTLSAGPVRAQVYGELARWSRAYVLR